MKKTIIILAILAVVASAKTDTSYVETTDTLKIVKRYRQMIVRTVTYDTLDATPKFKKVVKDTLDIKKK